MDPLGATASIITLVEIVLKTCKAINGLARSYRNVPVELAHLKYQLEGLKVQIILLHHVHQAASANELELDPTELSTLEAFLENVSPLFLDIQQHLESQSLSIGKRARIKWVLHDNSKVKEWGHALQRHTAILTNVLVLLNVKYSSFLELECKDIKQQISLQRSTKEQPYSKAWPRLLWTKETIDRWWAIPLLGRIRASVYALSDGSQDACTISLHIQALFCLKLFCMAVQIFHNSQLLPISVPFIRLTLSLKNVVPGDSPIMVACKRGNLSSVWALFQAREASVNDVTPCGLTPLRFAIQSGSLELVTYIINEGADVHATHGLQQTSPLQVAFAYRKIDIARLIISKGADVHHINARGRTAAINIFGFVESDETTTCDEYLDILKGQSIIDFDAQDCEGWSCMHAAAAYGNSNDIVSLLKAGATLNLYTKRPFWMPIFYAVQFGNISTFTELRKYHPGFAIMRDVRQWTLLHIALNAKRIQMAELLISLGADPHTTSLPTDFGVPEDLKGLAVTPGDIARLRGPDVFSAYTEALRTAGHEFNVVNDEGDDTEDLFWPALEAQKVLQDQLILQ